METSSKSRKRQELLHDLILHNDELSASELAGRLQISEATIRRDLAALERRGLIERPWGRARVRFPIRYLDDFKAVADREAAAKRSIAAAAIAHVKPGMVVGLSGGTTCTELARWLRGKPITVVTNAINVATELYNHSLTKVIVTGGSLNSYSYELVGDMVSSALHEYSLDICFVGCSGVCPDFGFSMRDHLESAVARAFLKVSMKSVVIADHTKVGERTFAKFAPLGATERLITDEGLSEAWQHRLETAGLRTERAPSLSRSV